MSTPGSEEVPPQQEVLELADELRDELGHGINDQLIESYYAQSASITGEAVRHTKGRGISSFDLSLDRILTSRIWGIPAMLLLLWSVFWLTIAGANVPSAMLATLTMDVIYDFLHSAAASVHAPAWLSGFLIDGVYLAAAWVFSVMLPPMAIFFPLFTILEDFGYLPRVAFNLDRIFHKCGAHGKQSLTMMMGFGCNAAGVVSTRIIDSPRERLIAIITNNFAICNGRWPTLILIGIIFIGALAPSGLASLAASAAVVGTCLLGIGFTLLVSAVLSGTLLKGEASTYSLELPPYRPPRIWQTIYTSLIDRTAVVLWRAIMMAAPAGAVIWLLSNIEMGDVSLAAHAIRFLSPLGWLVGLNGIILLAYIIAIPANEIVVPTILMLTLTIGIHDPGLAGLAQPGVMLEFEETSRIAEVLSAGGWTMLTAINLMLFCLLHNPCSTTLLTIWNETKSVKWTALSAIIPLSLGFGVCLVTATLARLLGLV